ncbi:MAG: protein kinase [Gammaproteobacteria bacterium]|nr:protein kinase [Gammaproteobacteria bacterium]
MKIKGYDILEKIGEGGMASVYKGCQLSLKRDVAIKTLGKELVNQQGFYERFERESLIIARLSNPYIIPIIERGITDDNIPYFIMEYVEGTDLKIAIQEDRLSFTQKLDICLQISKALSYAHKNGVIHRDIKPANILLDNEGNAKVMDFGIAQYYSEDIGGQKTQLGDMMGTLAYMSPEQHQSAALVTLKSDLYSFGVLMYKLFTHTDPIGRFKSPQEIDHKIPKILDETILACLATEPEKRPSSAEEVKNHLLQALGGAHLGTQQKLRTNTGIKNLELLDVIREEGQMSVSLYENKSDSSMLVINKRPSNFPGFTESKLLTTLKHKNIANILGTSKNDKFYIVVMSYNTGGELKDRLVNPMDIKEFLPMAADLVSALLFAHNNRIIHGNIRPSTIVFDQNDDIQLTDFGFRAPDKIGKTAANSQYKNGQESVSVQSDIYALGVVFYQMVTGQFPVLTSDQYKQNKHFRQLPAKLKDILSQMLKRNLKERPASCLPIEQAFKEILASRTQMGEEKTLLVSAPVEPKSKANYTKSIIVSLVLLTILLILVIVFYSDLQEVLRNLFEQSSSSRSSYSSYKTPNYIDY